MASPGTVDSYDRKEELRAFDAHKGGVKSVADAGADTIPRMFHLPPDDPIDAVPTAGPGCPPVPIIDLSGDPESILDSIRQAAGEWGIFHVVGHGVPAEVMEGMIEGTRKFHVEESKETKERLYTRGKANRKVTLYGSTFDLYACPTANWKDTLSCRMAPEPPEPEEVPATCRAIMFEFSKHMAKLGEALCQLLSQALGLNPSYLKDMECCKGHAILAHYYPPCPEPNRTLGASRHSDWSFLTILLQDMHGGLQVLHNDQWVDVEPIPGAFVINIGDMLQLMSNDKFTSIEHRVLVNNKYPRISVACFFSMFLLPSTITYGPIEELLSEENPPLYKKTSLNNYLATYMSKGFGVYDKPALLDFRL